MGQLHSAVAYSPGVARFASLSPATVRAVLAAVNDCAYANDMTLSELHEAFAQAGVAADAEAVEALFNAHAGSAESDSVDGTAVLCGLALASAAGRSTVVALLYDLFESGNDAAGRLSRADVAVGLLGCAAAMRAWTTAPTCDDPACSDAAAATLGTAVGASSAGAPLAPAATAAGANAAVLTSRSELLTSRVDGCSTARGGRNVGGGITRAAFASFAAASPEAESWLAALDRAKPPVGDALFSSAAPADHARLRRRLCPSTAGGRPPRARVGASLTPLPGLCETCLVLYGGTLPGVDAPSDELHLLWCEGRPTAAAEDVGGTPIVERLRAGGTSPGPRARHSACTVLGSTAVFVFGGAGADGAPVQTRGNSVCLLVAEPSGAVPPVRWTWPESAGRPPAPRVGAAALEAAPGVVVVFGGRTNKLVADVHVFELSACGTSGNWARIKAGASVAGPAGLPTAPRGASFTPLPPVPDRAGSALLVFGHSAGAACWRLDLFRGGAGTINKADWSSVACGAAPAAVAGTVPVAREAAAAVAVPLGDAGEVGVLVFGGSAADAASPAPLDDLWLLRLPPPSSEKGTAPRVASWTELLPNSAGGDATSSQLACFAPTTKLYAVDGGGVLDRLTSLWDGVHGMIAPAAAADEALEPTEDRGAGIHFIVSHLSVGIRVRKWIDDAKARVAAHPPPGVAWKDQMVMPPPSTKQRKASSKSLQSLVAPLSPATLIWATGANASAGVAFAPSGRAVYACGRAAVLLGAGGPAAGRAGGGDDEYDDDDSDDAPPAALGWEKPNPDAEKAQALAPDPEAGALTQRYLLDHDCHITSMSVKGNTCASGDASGRVLVWTADPVATLIQQVCPADGHVAAAVDLSPDGARVLVQRAAARAALAVYEIGAPSSSAPSTLMNDVPLARCAFVSPTLVVGLDDAHAVALWRLGSGRWIRWSPVACDPAAAAAAHGCLAPLGGERWASGTADDGMLCLWNARALEHRVRAHHSGVHAVAWGGGVLSTVGGDLCARCWTLNEDGAGAVCTAVVSLAGYCRFGLDGARLANAACGTKALLGTADGGLVTVRFDTPNAPPTVGSACGGGGGAGALACHPFQAGAAAVGDAHGRVWAFGTDRAPRAVARLDASCRALAYSPSATTLACLHGDGAVSVVMADTLAPVAEFARAPCAPRTPFGDGPSAAALAWSPDGAYLAAGDSVVTLWRAPLEGKKRSVWTALRTHDAGAEHCGGVTGLDFTADGAWLRASFASGHVVYLDGESGDACEAPDKELKRVVWDSSTCVYRWETAELFADDAPQLVSSDANADGDLVVAADANGRVLVAHPGMAAGDAAASVGHGTCGAGIARMAAGRGGAFCTTGGSGGGCVFEWSLDGVVPQDLPVAASLASPGKKAKGKAARLKAKSSPSDDEGDEDDEFDQAAVPCSPRPAVAVEGSSGANTAPAVRPTRCHGYGGAWSRGALAYDRHGGLVYPAGAMGVRGGLGKRQRLLGGFGGAVTATAVHPAGILAAVAGDGGVVTVWDLRADRVVTRVPCSAALGRVAVLTFSDDGATLVAGGRDGAFEARIWASGLLRSAIVPPAVGAALPRPAPAPTHALEFAPGFGADRIIQCGGSTPFVSVWALGGGGAAAVPLPGGFVGGPVPAQPVLAMARVGSAVVLGLKSGALAVLYGDVVCAASAETHARQASALAAAPGRDGLVWSVSKDASLALWQVEAPQGEREAAVRRLASVNVSSLLPRYLPLPFLPKALAAREAAKSTGDSVACCVAVGLRSGAIVELTGRVVKGEPVDFAAAVVTAAPGGTAGARALAAHPSATGVVAAAGGDGSVSVWRTGPEGSGAPVRAIASLPGAAEALAYAPRGRYIVAGLAVPLEAPGKRKKPKKKKGEPGPAGFVVLADSADDGAALEVVHTYPMAADAPAARCALAFSARGDALAVGSADGNVEVFAWREATDDAADTEIEDAVDAASDAPPLRVELLRTVALGEGAVPKALDFSADGATLTAVLSDGSAVDVDLSAVPGSENADDSDAPAPAPAASPGSSWNGAAAVCRSGAAGCAADAKGRVVVFGLSLPPPPPYRSARRCHASGVAALAHAGSASVLVSVGALDRCMIEWAVGAEDAGSEGVEGGGDGEGDGDGDADRGAPPAACLAFSRSGEVVLRLPGADATVAAAALDAPCRTLVDGGGGGVVECVAVSPSGDDVAVASVCDGTRTLRVVAANGSGAPAEVAGAPQDPVLCMAWAADGAKFVAACRGAAVVASSSDGAWRTAPIAGRTPRFPAFATCGFGDASGPDFVLGGGAELAALRERHGVEVGVHAAELGDKAAGMALVSGVALAAGLVCGGADGRIALWRAGAGTPERPLAACHCAVAAHHVPPPKVGQREAAVSAAVVALAGRGDVVATAARSEAVVRTWSAHDLLLLRVYPLAAEMGPTAGALCLRAGGTVGAVLCEDADKAVGADPYHPPPAVQCWLFSVFTGQWMGRVGL